ncbi:hypothetical protein [Dactylosporangium sp. NPDC049140]|uniref:hypothetical protein n=1 Tax=Dactylosporangium sp. NPDC049140 TaxID=3155647 RepID=UPI0033FB1FC0
MSEAYDYRLDRLARWGPEWTGGDLISCVDLVWDLGAQFNDAFLIGISHRDGALRGVYDVYGDDTNDLAVSRRVAKVAKQAVERVMALAAWNPSIAVG